jgi:cell division protein FtsQ
MKDYKYLPKKRRQTSFSKVIILVLIFIILIVTLIAVDVAWKRLPNVLKVNHVYVRGVKILSKDYLFDGVTINASLFKMNRDEICVKIGSKKWVKKVKITKIFPHTLVIDIEEKKPCIISEIKNKHYLLDRNGNIIDLYRSSFPINISRLLIIKQMVNNINSRIYKSIYEQCKYIENKLARINCVKLLSDHYMVVNMEGGIDIAFDPSHCNRRYVDNLSKIWSDLITKKDDIYLVDACYRKVVVIKWRRHGKKNR